MFLERCKYNHELYRVMKNRSQFKSMHVSCESHTTIFDNNGKKYIELYVGGSQTCVEFVSELERTMNERFDKKGSLPYAIVAKVPFRYGHFEIK